MVLVVDLHSLRDHGAPDEFPFVHLFLKVAIDPFQVFFSLRE